MIPISSKKLAQRAYFFDQGLRFECRRCGECCVGEPGTIYVSETEIKTISQYLGQSKDEFIDQYLYPYKDSYSIKEDDTGRCLFFDEGCTIYTIRPLQCRTFPFWFVNLRSPQNWQYVQSKCPGIGHGRCYARSEILEKIRESMPI